MTQKYEIKNRFTGEVLFSCDIPEGMESGMIARHALEEAVDNGANLWGANLLGANLLGANLWGANLLGANLWGANLRDAKDAPLIITSLRWPVYIGGTGMMRIGCQNHSVESWKNFTDEEIKRMDSNALDFWNKYKTMLLVACDTHVHAKKSEA